MQKKLATFFGTILRESIDARILVDIEPRMGDAETLGIGGQIWFARRECQELSEAKTAGVHDILRVPWHIAEAKAEAAGNIRPKRRRR